MRQFQQLMKMALLSGTLAGALLFVYQQFFVVPRILAAEAYEARTEPESESANHEHNEWKPANGFERTFFTAASTILTGIGFAAVFVSVLALSGASLNIRRGLFWGIAGFACFVVAPALGLPPEPPGVPVADVAARQLWWVGTAIATGVGLFLMFGSRPGWLFRMIGMVCLLLPHGIGAPKVDGPQIVPPHLLREFAFASIAGSGLFWLTLGIAGGRLLELDQKAPQSNRARQACKREDEFS